MLEPTIGFDMSDEAIKLLTDEPTTVFEGQDYLAKLTDRVFTYQRLVVTFDHWSMDKLRKPQFKQSKLFFARHGIAHLHVSTRCNDWFQSEEVGLLVASLKPEVAAYKHVTTYGSSMGAYGAIMFSKVLGANKVFACSPQFSVDHAKVPHESRWKMDREKISGFPFDDFSAQVSDTAKVVVVHDPWHRLDRPHMAQMAKLKPDIHFISLPLAGHPAIHVLQLLNLLGANAIPLLFDDPLPELRTLWRNNRKMSAQWRSNLVRHLLSSRKPKRINVAAQLVVEWGMMQESDPKNHYQFGKMLASSPSHRELGLSLIKHAIHSKSSPPKHWRWFLTKQKRIARKAESKKKPPPQSRIMKLTRRLRRAFGIK